MLKTKHIVELWNILIMQVNKEVLQNRKKKTHNLHVINWNLFMASLLSNLVNKLAGGIHKIKFKYQHDDKKCET